MSSAADPPYHRRMLDLSAAPPGRDSNMLAAIRRTWGYDGLRPMQAEAIQAGIDRRDSLVVLPTGGGKSLCYQVPPLVAERTDVVVSPLISLMKDQVDGLRECGYPAVTMHSGQTPGEQRAAEEMIASGKCRLVLVSPERVLTARFIRLMQMARVSTFAIDEAHCISHWGHDFRPEYRRLGGLKDRFADVSVHAYTATATERVREDIKRQLGLRDPLVLVGCFDRPNLTYRIVPREKLRDQVLSVLRRHRREAAIIYCVSRRETEALAAHLRSEGIRAAYYHAGMDPEPRRLTQDQFSNEKLDVVVATVAFGMGIDRSDVRCVIHAAMPKSVEHYQQETGRAGRDGLPAECVLFHSGADSLKWRMLLDRSRDETLEGMTDNGDGSYAVARETLEAAHAAQCELIEHMRRLCLTNACRHRLLSAYFGQTLAGENCGACDVCLGEVERHQEATVLAQKILSCVARVEERFGAGHVADVLLGSTAEAVLRCGHDKLSTYGLLGDLPKRAISHQIDQLLAQELLERRSNDRGLPILKLNAASWEVLRGKRSVFLPRPSSRIETATPGRDSVEFDRELFEELRQLRRKIAEERGLAPFLIFNDRTLRDIATKRPRTRSAMRTIHGVGDRKLEDLGDAFSRCVDDFLRARETPR
ncbi:MAG: RecQ family ATP-dependent DNA helicase [Planctomycetes bacterium]|nr:RecQ family ATP-dependent DNA helicase [Planctomycetota bacterium]